MFYRTMRLRVKWYTLAAEQGNAECPILVWVGCTQLGQGVPQDYKTAVKWYTLAAEQGIADCPVQSGFYVREGTRCSAGL